MTSAVDAAACERAAIRAHLLGADDECAKQWEAAARAALAHGDPAESARYAFWLGLGLMMRGQAAPANGWFSRARDLIDEAGTDCRASGYVLIPTALAALDDDPRTAREIAVRCATIGARFGDADLSAFGALAEGQALIAMGDPTKGVARLDEVMVRVMAAELGPITSGIVYCAVILECMNLYDMRRASEWTNALVSWCDSRPQMVPFRGQCLVHRSQLEQAEGNWDAAVASAQAACVRLGDPAHPALGFAHYQRGELRRLLGDFAMAEQDYRQAGRHGYDPMPGLALLQLARGDSGAAAGTIHRALHEHGGSAPRLTLLAAGIEIFMAAGDFAALQRAVDEVCTAAARFPSEVQQAMAAQAQGSADLAAGNVSTALVQLRTAAQTWRTLRMPYDVAKVATLLGLACAAVGDQAGAEVEFESARAIFTELGAMPDVRHVSTLMAGLTLGSQREATLSAREREVLRHLAAGRSNREIAEKLVVSPHTVARHIEHIYAKLGVTNRTAATACAYEHHLV